MEIAGLKPSRTAFFAVLALVAFAANSVLCRLALGEATIDPASYTVVRLFAGAMALALIARVSSRPSPAAGVPGWTSAAMLFLYAASFSFAYISLSTGVGALILFASVQMTMVGIGLYRGERPGLSEWSGLFIALLGLVYLLSPGITAPPLLGSALMATAGFAWGIYSLRGQGAIDPTHATTANFLRAAPMALAVMFLWLPNLKFTPWGFLLALISGAVTSGLGYVIWYAALRGLTAARAATVQLSVPVIAAFGGAIFLSEAITLRLFLSAVAILGGILVAVFARMPKAGREICQRA